MTAGRAGPGLSRLQVPRPGIYGPAWRYERVSGRFRASLGRWPVPGATFASVSALSESIGLSGTHLDDDPHRYYVFRRAGPAWRASGLYSCVCARHSRLRSGEMRCLAEKNGTGWPEPVTTEPTRPVWALFRPAPSVHTAKLSPPPRKMLQFGFQII